MNAGQLAALIAAGFFAVLASVAMLVLLRFGRLVSAVTRLVTDYRDKADLLIEQAQEAVDRTNAQLARTDAITASMDQVTANMAELSGHVSALAGVARGISSAATAPLTGVSAFMFGLRRAMLVRRTLQVAAVAEPVVGTPVVATPVVAATGLDSAPERAAIAAGRRPGRLLSRR
jgi:uncharacterized protein YoxC